MAILQALGINRIDPLRIHVELPLHASFYPVGFRLDIVTNSPDVLDAAREAWGHYSAEYDNAPISFRVMVVEEGELAGVPTHRMQGHLYSVVSDAHNFAHFDMTQLFGFFQVSRKTAADHTWLRWFFLESLGYMLLAQRYLVPIHAACIERRGTGLLLCGRSGAGKSTLSYACAREGWTYVTDDCTFLLADSDERIAIGRPRQARFCLDAPELFPELEGFATRSRPTGKVGIQVPVDELPNIRAAARAPIGGIVFLDRRPGAVALEKIEGEQAMRSLLSDMPSYGDSVDAMHERTLRKLFEVPAYRMRYQTLRDAIETLDTLIP